MHIRISKTDLLRHVNIAQKAISNKSSIQILEGIVFETRNNFLYLISTDMELSIETFVECEVLKPGSIVIKSDIIGNIIRKMPDDFIEIEVVDENIKIKSQKSLFNIKGQDSIDYPALPVIDEDPIIILANKDLDLAIKETLFATSVDETKLAITGIFLEILDETIKFIGLDGYRMAIKEYSYSVSNPTSCIVPKRAFSELAKIIDTNDTDISIIKGHILFKNGSTKMYSRLIDKSYIDYNKILVNDFKTKLLVNRDDLLSSLDRALLISSGGSTSLTKLSIEDGLIKINSNSELGNLDESVDCSQDGPNLNIAFNTRYLLDGLRAIDDDEVVLYLNHALAPLVMKPVQPEQVYLYLVLPVRLSQ